MKCCYVVTCESKSHDETKISGVCYHSFLNAIKFVESRSDNPKFLWKDNPFIWESEEHIYKIHTLTFDDEGAETND